MATEVGNTLPAAEDLATVLHEILGSSHRADPAQRKLLHDQACIFIQSIRPFRFLDLPRELRDVIYTHVLVTDGPLLVSGACKSGECPGQPPPSPLSSERVAKSVWKAYLSSMATTPLNNTFPISTLDIS
ncbi:hypothetical protein LTR27_008051 [Elasticomyces elasticus]|nr:hypothetical protein LTR27_008051 [Elasticomyces elasticus]